MDQRINSFDYEFLTEKKKQKAKQIDFKYGLRKQKQMDTKDKKRDMNS